MGLFQVYLLFQFFISIYDLSQIVLIYQCSPSFLFAVSICYQYVSLYSSINLTRVCDSIKTSFLFRNFTFQTYITTHRKMKCCILTFGYGLKTREPKLSFHDLFYDFMIQASIPLYHNGLKDPFTQKLS